MNKTLAALAIALITATTLMMQSPETTMFAVQSGIPLQSVSEFNAWKSLYGIQYDSAEMEQYRLKIFYLNTIKIANQNAANDGAEYGINEFTAFTNEEWAAIYLTGVIVPEDVVLSNEVEVQDLTQTAINWVQKGKVSPVKNQGQCGSCWAFSTTGALESLDAVFKNVMGDFSEQQLVDCSTAQGNQGCNGGWPSWAFNYVIKNGITTEQAYPYTGRNGACRIQGGAFKIASYTAVPANNCNSAYTALQRQPLSVCVDASNWSSYKSGIFSNCQTQINHAVLAAGNDADGNWLIKNSWGTSWGQQGYITLRTGNTCGVCSTVTYPNF